MKGHKKTMEEYSHEGNKCVNEDMTSL